MFGSLGYLGYLGKKPILYLIYLPVVFLFPFSAFRLDSATHDHHIFLQIHIQKSLLVIDPFAGSIHPGKNETTV